MFHAPNLIRSVSSSTLANLQKWEVCDKHAAEATGAKYVEVSLAILNSLSSVPASLTTIFTAVIFTEKMESIVHFVYVR